MPYLISRRSSSPSLTHMRYDFSTNYSPAYKHAIACCASKPPRRPDACPKCSARGKVFNRLCYREDIAGQWEQICGGCHKFVTRPGLSMPDPEGLQIAFAIRRSEPRSDRELGLELGGGNEGIHAQREALKVYKADLVAQKAREREEAKEAKKAATEAKANLRNAQRSGSPQTKRQKGLAANIKMNKAREGRSTMIEDLRAPFGQMRYSLYSEGSSQTGFGKLQTSEKIKDAGEETQDSVPFNKKAPSPVGTGKRVDRKGPEDEESDGDEVTRAINAMESSLKRTLVLHLYPKDGQPADRFRILLGRFPSFRFNANPYLHAHWAHLTAEDLGGERSAFEVWRTHISSWETYTVTCDIPVWRWEDDLVVRKCGVQNLPGFAQYILLRRPSGPAARIELHTTGSPPSVTTKLPSLGRITEDYHDIPVLVEDVDDSEDDLAPALHPIPSHEDPSPPAYHPQGNRSIRRRSASPIPGPQSKRTRRITASTEAPVAGPSTVASRNAHVGSIQLNGPIRVKAHGRVKASTIMEVIDLTHLD